DFSNAGLVPGSVHVIHKPDRGNTRVNADGSITYIPTIRKPSRDQFVYEVCDKLNLCDSATVTIDIYDTDVTAPEGFSPNGDGINDHLVFNGLEHYPNTELYIYTRSGQLVYQSLDYKNDWDGRFLTNAITNEKLVPTGVYYYVLKLGGTTRVIKGYVFIGY
ncbi:MAG TPA: gliding motility-associated C-terminal domain-containing protein, partial [Prolixibacteraceae bacterium]